MSEQDDTSGLSEKSEINGRIMLMRQICDLLAVKAREVVLQHVSDLEHVGNGLKDLAAKKVKANVKSITTRASKLAAKIGDPLPVPVPPITTYPTPNPPGRVPIPPVPLPGPLPGPTPPGTGPHCNQYLVLGYNDASGRHTNQWSLQIVGPNYVGPAPPAWLCYLGTDPASVISCIQSIAPGDPVPPVPPLSNPCGPVVPPRPVPVPQPPMGGDCPCGSWKTPYTFPDGGSGVACGTAPYPSPDSGVPSGATPTAQSQLVTTWPDGSPCDGPPVVTPPPVPVPVPIPPPVPIPQPGPICCPAAPCPTPVVQCPPPPAIDFAPIINVTVGGQICEVQVIEPPPPPPPPPIEPGPPGNGGPPGPTPPPKPNQPSNPEMPVHWNQPGSFLFGSNAQVYRDQLWGFLGIESVEDTTTLDSLVAMTDRMSAAFADDTLDDEQIPEDVL